MQLEPRELSHEPVLEPRWLDVDTASRIPLHDASCALPPGGATSDSIHQERSERQVRSRGARSLDEQGGEVWLWRSAAASGTSGR